MSQHLFIDNKATELRVGKTYLEIRQPERRIASIPFHLLSHVTIACDLALSTHIIHRLCSEGITVTLLSGKSKQPATQCFAMTHGHHARRLAQYRVVLDQQTSLAGAQRLVKKKIHSYIRQVHRFIRYRPELKHEGELLIGEFRVISTQIQDRSLKSLLGIEGNAAKRYFNFFGKLMPPTMPFNGRNKRPPKDPVNALLSLTYSLFTSECARALEACGLDPAFGLYHQVAYQRPSAACDLVELFRTQADFFVWRLVAEQQLRPEHFGQQLSACVLNKTGKSIYFSAYFAQLDSCRQRFYRYARQIAQSLHHLDSEEIDYVEHAIEEIDC